MTGAKDECSNKMALVMAASGMQPRSLKKSRFRVFLIAPALETG
jgi:hypothetical protein